jgi:hypothetical protein
VVAQLVAEAVVNVKLAASYAVAAQALVESPAVQSWASTQPLAIVVDMVACAVAACGVEEAASYTAAGGDKEVAIAVPPRNGVEEACSTVAGAHIRRTGD